MTRWIAYLVARVRDWADRRHRIGWFADAGTYDGLKAGRPQRHIDRWRSEAPR